MGLDLRRVKPSHTVVMLGASRPAVTHTVTLSLPEFDEAWEAEVDFLLEDILPFGVLGDEGFRTAQTSQARGLRAWDVRGPQVPDLSIAQL